MVGMGQPASRVCRGCKQNKPLDQFSLAPRGKYGRKARCKTCDAERHKAQKVYVTDDEREANRRAIWIAKNSGPKLCRYCGESKPRDQFGVSRQGKWGPILRTYCKECSSRRAREWYHDNPNRANANRRDWNLQQYGLTTQDYNDMLRSQGGVCAICGQDEPTKRFNRLSVDHCHDTGEVRGLLCSRCNRALGLLNDDATVLRKAISYLRRGGK